MFKIFRKIRFDLMEKNKTGKYLKYAIGEIILVVIGILIALQINNWNEEQKLQRNIKGIYSIIKNDLADDIKQIDRVIQSMSERDSLYQMVLTADMTFDDYKKNEDLAFILSGFPDIKLNQRGIDLLNQNLTSFNTNQDSLLILVNAFYSYFNTEIEVALEEVTMDYNDNRYYFKNNMIWFEDYQTRVLNDDFINYALTSQDYRNRLRSFHILFFNVYLMHLKEYNEEALKIMDAIDKEIA